MLKQYEEYGMVATARRIKNDVHGNPRYGVRVYLIKEHLETHEELTPKVKGYRYTATNGYTVQYNYHSISSTLDQFMSEFYKQWIGGNN